MALSELGSDARWACHGQAAPALPRAKLRFSSWSQDHLISEDARCMHVCQEIFLHVLVAVSVHRTAQQVGRYLMATQARQIHTISIAPPLPSAGPSPGALSEHDKLGIPLSYGKGDRFAPSPCFSSSPVVGCALVPKELFVFPTSWQHVSSSPDTGIHELVEMSQIAALELVWFAWNNKMFAGLD